MPKNKQALLLLSGGIDSTTLLAQLSQDGYTVTALSFCYGQKHRVELAFARQNALTYRVERHEVVTLPPLLFSQSALVDPAKPIEVYPDQEVAPGPVSTYVPFRNLVFLSQALSWGQSLGVDAVFAAFNADDHANFWDCRPLFIEQLNQLVAGNASIQVQTPFIHLTKQQVIKKAHQLGVDLSQTISCYQPTDKEECGSCLSCVTKRKALQALRLM